MNEISINFSAMLLCILTVFSMMGLIFDGSTNTLPKYFVSAAMSGTALIVFGIVADDTVRLIIELT